MERICEHCGALIADNAYRVTSEEVRYHPTRYDCWLALFDGGEKPSTFMQRKSMLEANELQLDTEEVTIRDSELNFNTGNTCSVIERSWPS
jgi:hypothetical protein